MSGEAGNDQAGIPETLPVGSDTHRADWQPPHGYTPLSAWIDGYPAVYMEACELLRAWRHSQLAAEHSFEVLAMALCAVIEARDARLD